MAAGRPEVVWRKGPAARRERVTAAPATMPGDPSRDRVSAQQAVDHPVPPGTVAPSGGTRDPLPGEPRLLEGFLLGDVAHFGPRPDAVRRGVREQVPGKQALRLRAVTAAPGLRQQHDADFPAEGARHGDGLAAPAD